MHALGINERKAMNVMGYNHPHWVIAFMGGILYNCVASGIYSTNTSEACQYQAEHSEAEIIVVDTVANLKKIESILHKLPLVKAVVCFAEEKLEGFSDSRFYTWRSFMQLGKDVKMEVINEKMNKQKAGKCACLIYTSGTTGMPKGVMLSHDNMTSNSMMNKVVLGQSVQYDSEDRIVSYLPLSHIAGL